MKWFWNILDWFMGTEAMVRDFERRFPGKCMICSYHRYGVMEGHVAPGSPVPDHICNEPARFTPCP